MIEKHGVQIPSLKNKEQIIMNNEVTGSNLEIAAPGKELSYDEAKSMPKKTLLKA